MLLLDPVEIVISYVYQILYFMDVKFIILYDLPTSFIYLNLKNEIRKVTLHFMKAKKLFRILTMKYHQL